MAIKRSECPQHLGRDTLTTVNERGDRWCAACGSWVEPVTAEHVPKQVAGAVETLERIHAIAKSRGDQEDLLNRVFAETSEWRRHRSGGQ